MPLRQEVSEARARDHPRMGRLGAAAGCMLFFVHLQQDKSELLDFHSTGDKWQTVHGWLRREGRVKD
jgi:hypothetical protein